MPTKAIKDVDEDAWNFIKSLSAEKGMSMGKYFNNLARELKENEKESKWEKILNWKAEDPKEITNIEKRVKEFRKRFQFRVFK